MSILLIADSRGRGLQLLLQSLRRKHGVDDEIQVMFHPGNGYEMVALKSLKQITQTKPKLIVIMAGICDLTYKNRMNKITTLRHSTVRENTEHVINAARSSHDLLKSVSTAKIAYATLTGIDIADYNHPPRKHMTSNEYRTYNSSTKVTHEMQHTLNSSVIEINRQLTALNKTNSVPTIWTGGVVHNYSSHKHYHYYIRLTDGCHADDQTKAEWAVHILKAIKRINKPITTLVTGR